MSLRFTIFVQQQHFQAAEQLGSLADHTSSDPYSRTASMFTKSRFLQLVSALGLIGVLAVTMAATPATAESDRPVTSVGTQPLPATGGPAVLPLIVGILGAIGGAAMLVAGRRSEDVSADQR